MNKNDFKTKMCYHVTTFSGIDRIKHPGRIAMGMNYTAILDGQLFRTFRVKDKTMELLDALRTYRRMKRVKT